MNGNNILIDTNVALLLLSGNKTITTVLHKSTVYISFITQLELLGYKGISDKEQQKIQSFIDDCIIVDLTGEIKQHTIQLRKKYTVKLPDGIIAATAMYLELPLFTADKGFKKVSEINLMLYEE